MLLLNLFISVACMTLMMSSGSDVFESKSLRGSNDIQRLRLYSQESDTEKKNLFIVRFICHIYLFIITLV